ncbi:MAG TPA: hypothetical protein VIA18_22435 [Polyangia bacterium]|jgi:hypothetical protein|nr:hypothetical protein [Polyangia bacterium]
MFVHELTSVQSGPTHGGVAHTFAALPAPQYSPAGQLEPQSTVLPQPSEMMPQSAPALMHVAAVHALPLPLPMPPLPHSK